MRPNTSCCCGDTKQRVKYPVTRPPCGREYLTGCGDPLLKTSFDSAWGKPVWLREIFKNLKAVKSPQHPWEYEQIIRKGGVAGFNRDLADPAYEWDHKDPIWIYSTRSTKPESESTGDYRYLPGLGAAPSWPLSEKIASSETDVAICDNPWYKLITHYPSVGRPFQNASENPVRSAGLMLSNISPDFFPGKQIEEYNYFPKKPEDVGYLNIKENSHDKNVHTNTAYPGKYWISWWNAIHPGNVVGYNGVDIFNGSTFNLPSVKIKCDEDAGAHCDQVGCKGDTLADEWFDSVKIQKVSTGEYHNCALFGNSSCFCWGLTTANRLDVPSGLTAPGTVYDINCGKDWTVATTVYGLTFWGNASSALKNIPEEVKNISNIKKLSAGGNFCVALLKTGKLSLWGSAVNRLNIKPKKATETKTFKISDTIEWTIRKDQIIPFWGERSQLYSIVNNYENSVDEFGTKNDPISIEINFTDIWAGKYHIVGLASAYFTLAKEDLKDLASIYNIEESKITDIESRVFSWGLGMPGDRLDPSNNYARQCCPNYFAQESALQLGKDRNQIQLNLLDKDNFEETSLTYIDNFYGIDNTIPLFTSPIANHTVFVRFKYPNRAAIANALSSPSSYSDWNGDPPKCPPIGPRDPTNDCNLCKDTLGTPRPGTRPSVNYPTDGDCGIQANPNGDYPCCLYNGYECCMNFRGLMFDGWGDDSNGQITGLGTRYFSPNYYTSSINKNFAGLDANAINSDPNISNYSFKCALGSDRTVVTLTKYPPTTNKITTEIYHTNSGESSTCIDPILGAYGGRTKPVQHLTCGVQHNIVVQDPDEIQIVDYPYIGDADKGKKITWKQKVTAPSTDTGIYTDSPRIIMGNSNGKNDWHQPVFDPDTASRLLYNLDVIIRKYKKQPDGKYIQVDYLRFKNDNDTYNTHQKNGISVNLIGTRGDQRLKPFTGATCDCVWSDYATDSLKVGGHQGVILNHVGFDDRTDIRKTDKAYSWIEFNELVGDSDQVAGGHEQPWVNFETAGLKAFSEENYNTVNYWDWSSSPNKPRINYWLAPPNTFTHNIIEIPPGRFPSELSYPCRSKYCYGGPNNVIQNWCDPCFKGITTPTSAITGWKGRLGCTGCENNYNSSLCQGCTFNIYGVWECFSAPPIREVYGYKCASSVFGNILPDEIIITRTEKQEDDEITKISPQLKNQVIYQEEIILRDGRPVSSESWKVGEITNIKQRIMTFIPVETRDEINKEKPIDSSKPFYFILKTPSGGASSQVTFKNYTHKNYDNNCEYYNSKFMKLNSFGEPSTPIEEAWPSLNRYFIPRWASLLEHEKKDTWVIKNTTGDPTKDTVIQSYTEIDYPLVVVPAHGGDIGPKYNMEGYFDTELFSILYKNNPLFKAKSSYSSETTERFMPGRAFSAFHKSRYIKDSIDFEYPFNKNINTNVSGMSLAGYYMDFRRNEDGRFISFTIPPPGVFFDTRDIANTNFRTNGIRKAEPLCGDTETGCSSCAIPFTGARTAAWGFDLYNEDLVKAIQTIIPELTGDPIRDIEVGNLTINPKNPTGAVTYNGVWLGIAKDRTVSTSGKSVKRIRIMMPIDLAPGETIMFGRGINFINQSDTYLDDGTRYFIQVSGDFNQYPNDKNQTVGTQKYENYEYRWGRFSDECACDSRISLNDINYTDTDYLDQGKELIQKFKDTPTQLTKEEKAKLIIGDPDTQGMALVRYSNCVNPITYLESGETPVLSIGTPEISTSIIGLSDISSIWPIWNKSMHGNGYYCDKNTMAFHIGADGNEIIDPIRLYSGKGPDTGTIWKYSGDRCKPIFSLSGTGIRGFWSDWLSSRGYSTFLTQDENKDRIGGDIPFEASHPQGWLGAGFVNPTDGYWTGQIGGDSIGDILTSVCNWLPTTGDGIVGRDIAVLCQGGEPYPTASGSMWSSLSLWNYLQWGKQTIYENWTTTTDPDGGTKFDECRPIPAKNDAGEIFPKTQNKKRQILKMCCFGDNYLSEPPSSVTEAIMPDRYSINTRKNKYRNLYNAGYRSHPINPGTRGQILFRSWHGDPFNPADYDTRLKGTPDNPNYSTPVWADYWWAWNYNIPQCGSQYEWFKNIQEWRHRRWDLPLFIGVNRDNIGTFFINDPSPECTPETCPGLELTDSSYKSGPFAKLGWNYRKYDCITSQTILNPGSLKWSTSRRGANTIDGTITPARACGQSCWKTNAGAPPYPGTFYAMNNAIWYNCYAAFRIPDYSGATDGVVFSIDYSRWNQYFHYLGPGFMTADEKFNTQINRIQWYK